MNDTVGRLRLIPTHFGGRTQLELSAWIVSVSGGANVVANRIDGRLGSSFDFTFELSPGLSAGLGGSGTVGPLVGWASSSVDDVISGNSAIVSGAAAMKAH